MEFDDNAIGAFVDAAKNTNHGIKMILIVDDSFFAIDHFHHCIQVIDPFIEVVFARSTDEAKKRFLELRDEIDIVLMDYRLLDAASGGRLTRNFLIVKPDLIILANSALKHCNKELMDLGCKAIIAKKIPAFFQWWGAYFEAL